MKRFITLTLQYYRLLLVFNLTFTVLSIVIFVFYLGRVNPGTLYVGKLAGFIAAAAIHYYSAKETYFYFRNAGYRMGQIIIAAFIADIIIYWLLVILYSLIVK